MQKNETGPLFYTIHKNQIEINEGLNIRPDTIKLVEQNLGSKLLGLSHGNDFFEFDTKSKGNKSKNKQVKLHQMRKFLHSKENHQQNKKTTQ